MKVLCLYTQLVPSLKVLDELLLRYEYSGQDIPIPWKCIMRCHGNYANSHSSNGFILSGNILSSFRCSHKRIEDPGGGGGLCSLDP